MPADIPRPYLEWESIFRDCPECGARQGELCEVTSPVNGETRTRFIPCVARTKPEETEQ